MLLRIEELPHRQGLLLRGELDLSNASAFLDAAKSCVPDTSGDLIVDLSDLTFMDSTGLGVVVQVASLLDGKGKLILLAPGRAVARLFEITGVDAMANLEIQHAAPPSGGPATN